MQIIVRNLYFKIFFIVVLLYTLLGFVLLPYFLQHYLPSVIYSMTGAQTSIYKTFFNPYTFELSLDNLVIQDENAMRLASFSTLEVDFDVDDLLEGKLLFKKIYLKHLKVDIRIDTSGRYNFQYILDHIAASSEGEVVVEDSNSSLIGIRIPKLHIDDARILFEDASMREPFSVKTRPFDFELKDFSTVFDEAGELHFLIATHESGSIQSTATIALQPFGVKGDFSISDFNTNKLYSYIKENVDFKLEGHRVNMTFDYDLSYQLGRLDFDVLNTNIDVDRLLYSDANQSIGFSSLQSKIKGIHLSKENTQLNVKAMNSKLKIEDVKFTNSSGALATLEVLESNLSSVEVTKPASTDISIDIQRYLFKLQDLNYEDPIHKASLDMLVLGFHKTLLTLEDALKSVVNGSFVDIEQLHYAGNKNRLSLETTMLKMPDLQLKEDGNVSANITAFKISSIDLKHRNHKLLQMKEIAVEDVDVDTRRQEYNITKVMLERAHMTLRLYKDLSTDFNHMFPASKKIKKEKKVVVSTKPRLSIKDIWLKDSRVDFIDLQHKPIYLSTKHINTHIKDVTLEDKHKIPFTFSYSTPRKGWLSGWGNVRLKPFALNLNLKVKRMDLRPYMPYVKPFVNLDMKKGYLTTAIKFRYQEKAREKMTVNGDISLEEVDIYHDIKQERLMRVKEIKVKAFTYKENYLKIDNIVIDRPYNKIFIDADRSTNFDDLMVTSKVKSSKKASIVKKDKKKPFVYMLAEVEVKEGSMDFTDLSLPLRFQTHVDKLSGKVIAISSNAKETTHVNLDGIVDTYGLAEIKGTLITANPTKQSDIKVDFKNINVVNMSPYSGKFIGRKIKSGKLWMDLGYKINDNILMSSNKIKIKDLELGEVVDSNASSDLPIGLAIALLKDQDGYIDVSVPIEGDVNAPDFKYGAAAWKAVGDLITGIASSPFKFLGSALGMDAEKMSKIEFAFGSALLKAPEKEKLDNLLTLLAKRPELTLVLTPSYHKSKDIKALQTKKLYALALNKFKKNEDPISKYTFVKALYVKSFSKEQYEVLYEKSKTSLKKGDDLDQVLFKVEVDALTALQVITKKELETLAKKRSEVVRAYLDSKGLNKKYIEVSTKVEVEDTLVDGNYMMTLGVDVHQD